MQVLRTCEKMWAEGQQRDIPLNFVSLKKQKHDGIFC